MDRRNFIKKTFGACSAISIGTLLSSTLLESCKTAAISVYKTAPNNGLVSIPLSSFAASDFKLVRVSDYGYDIGVIKNGSDYTALLLMCTHAGQSLTRTGNGYYCTLHGSRFDNSGNVLKGPASDPLQHLKLKQENGQLLVELDPAYLMA